MAGGFPALSGNEPIKILAKEFYCTEAERRTVFFFLKNKYGDLLELIKAKQFDSGGLTLGTLKNVTIDESYATKEGIDRGFPSCRRGNTGEY
jgi:hypothetical protein